MLTFTIFILIVIGLISTYFLFKRSSRRKRSEIDRLLFDNLETFDRLNHPETQHSLHESHDNEEEVVEEKVEEDSLAPKRFTNSSDYLKKRYPNLDKKIDITKQKEDLYKQYKNSNDLVKQCQNSADPTKVYQTLTEAARNNASKYSIDPPTYPEHNNGIFTEDTLKRTTSEDDFITNSADLCNALNKIDSLNIKDENKQFLVDSIDPTSPQIRGRSNETEYDPPKHSALKALLQKRQEFNAAPMRFFDTPKSRDSSSKSSPYQVRTPPTDVIKGQTTDAYANFRRGSMSPQERIMENIKNLGQNEQGNVRPSKARNPEYVPQEEEPFVYRHRGVIATPKIKQKCQASVAAFPAYAAPGPFSYINALEPRANFKDLKARNKLNKSFEESEDKPEEVQLTSGKRRGSVKNLAKMFDRSPSPMPNNMINKRSRHKSDGMSLSQAKPLTKSKSLVFDDSMWSLDQSEAFEPKSCSYKSNYDDGIEQPPRDRYNTQIISDYETAAVIPKRDRFNTTGTSNEGDGTICYSTTNTYQRTEPNQYEQSFDNGCSPRGDAGAYKQQQLESGYQTSENIEPSRTDKYQRTDTKNNDPYQRDETRRFSVTKNQSYNQSTAREEEEEEESLRNNSFRNIDQKQARFEYREDEHHSRERSRADNHNDSDVESTSSLSRAVSPVRSSNRKNFKKSRKSVDRNAQSDKYSSMMSGRPISYGDSNEDLIGSGSSTTSLKENDIILDSLNKSLDKDSMTYDENKTAEPHTKRKIPLSIKEYQQHFNLKQEKLQHEQRQTRQQARPSQPHHTSSHIIEPRGLIKCSPAAVLCKGEPKPQSNFMNLIATAAPKAGATVKRAHSLAAPGSAASKKQALLYWCQKMTEDHLNVDIKNFSSSWNNGMAFCALFHHFLPDQIDYEALVPTNREANFTIAFREGEKAGVTALLDVEDMVEMKNPDWQSVMTYISLIYNHFNGIRVGGPRLPPHPNEG